MATADYHYDESAMDPSSEVNPYESLLSPCSPVSPSFAGKVYTYSFTCVHIVMVCIYSGNLLREKAFMKQGFTGKIFMDSSANVSVRCPAHKSFC